MQWVIVTREFPANYFPVLQAEDGLTNTGNIETMRNVFRTQGMVALVYSDLITGSSTSTTFEFQTSYAPRDLASLRC